MADRCREEKILVNRDKLTDCLKGYACLLVVFGHVIQGIRNAGIIVPNKEPMVETFLWSFHVALFMFLSGYVYYLRGGGKVIIELNLFYLSC